MHPIDLCERIAVKLIDAQFLPYEQVIPRDHKKIITVDRMRLVDALRRAQLMSSETRGVKIAAAQEGVTITSDNTRPRRGPRGARGRVQRRAIHTTHSVYFRNFQPDLSD